MSILEYSATGETGNRAGRYGIAAVGVMAVVTAALGWQGGAGAAPPALFKTPSGNIVCEIAGHADDTVHFVRCDIEAINYTPPTAPPGCGVRFGHTAVMAEGGAPRFVCPHDTMTANTRLSVANYPTSMRQGKFRCDTTTDAVVCSDLGSRNSFLLSRDNYEFN